MQEFEFFTSSPISESEAFLASFMLRDDLYVCSLEETIDFLEQELRETTHDLERSREELNRTQLDYQKELDEANAEIAELQRQLEHEKNKSKVDSSNSGKPPSTDKSRKKRNVRNSRGKSDKPSGGQVGHEGQTLDFVEEPDKTIRLEVEVCDNCGADLSDTPAESCQTRQVHDIVPPKPIIIQYEAERKLCPECAFLNTAKFPSGVKAPVQYGPYVQLYSVYFNHYQLIPTNRVVEVWRDLFSLPISEGTLYRFPKNLAPIWQEQKGIIFGNLMNAKVTHADESSLFVNGDRYWLFVVSNAEYTYYFAHRNRSFEAMKSGGILDVLDGFMMHDHYKAYLKFHNCVHLFCNAHHLRELERAIDEEQAKWANSLKQLLLNAKAQAEQLRQQGENQLPREQIEAIHQAYETILQEGEAFYQEHHKPRVVKGKTSRSKGHNLLIRLHDHQIGVLSFIHDFDLPFDNNQAERDIRMIKVKQKISGCFRTEEYLFLFCDIRSMISTWRKQGTSFIEGALPYFLEWFPHHKNLT